MINIIELSRNEISAVSGGLTTTDIQDACKLVLQCALLYWFNDPSERLRETPINHTAMRIRHTAILFLGYNALVLVGSYLFF
jgi:hypothetical protein